jgi:hypothetical protein
MIITLYQRSQTPDRFTAIRFYMFNERFDEQSDRSNISSMSCLSASDQHQSGERLMPELDQGLTSVNFRFVRCFDQDRHKHDSR